MLEKAMELLGEHRKEYVFYNHNQKAAFVQRLRRLAAKVECKAESNYQTVLTLDVIATRCNVYLRYKDEADRR